LHQLGSNFRILSSLLNFLTVSDIAGDFGRSDDTASVVSNGRDSERYAYQPSVFSFTNSLKVVHALALWESLNDSRFLLQALSRDDKGYRFTDSLFRRISEQSLGSRVSAKNDAV
jgi:hypothetical protein